MTTTTNTFKAGAAEKDISPQRSLPLAGYPFVKRDSTGGYDPLLSTAIYITDGITATLFIGNDVLFVSKTLVQKVRTSIAKETGVPAGNILISATHTHSGPMMVRFAAGEHDKNLAEPDPEYLDHVESAMVAAAKNAISQADDATLGITIADATGIGTNRQNPAGPADLSVPVLSIRSAKDNSVVAVMAIVNMHPTVLREDSRVVSGDFPGIARQILQREVFEKKCPVLFHLGACGDQSPRHVVKANTLSEAERLGRILATAISKNLNQPVIADDVTVKVEQHFLSLVRKTLPEKIWIRNQVDASIENLMRLRETSANRQEIRLAEVNWFGAVELSHLRDLADAGLLDAVYASCLPAEIQIISIAQWTFIGWPGEVFIEYALEIRKRHKNAFVITLANGELQGYIVTKAAAEKGGYEASNAIFDYTSGDALVTTTLFALTN